jgi:hypothetical protein
MRCAALQSCLFGSVSYHDKGLIRLGLPLVALALLWLAFPLEPWVRRALGAVRSRGRSSAASAADGSLRAAETRAQRELRSSQYIRASIAAVVASQGALFQLGLQSILPCLSAGPDGEFLVADPSVNCRLSDDVDGGTRFMFALTGFALLVLVLALVVGTALYHRRLQQRAGFSDADERARRRFELRFGSLFQKFRPGLQLYECATILRRTALIVVYVGFWHVPESREIALNTANVLFFVLHVAVRPYRRDLRELTAGPDDNAAAAVGSLADLNSWGEA